ncbi:MAG: hypothetical protein H0W11_07025 [Gemmatimonadetes bacterium]|nr:hypothetical protein [Gemmatimonadota bacterium]
MHYEDETRRYNLLSGMLLGTLLGSGFTLLAVTGKRRWGGGRSRRSRGWRQGVAAAWSGKRDGAIAQVVSSARERLHL